MSCLNLFESCLMTGILSSNLAIIARAWCSEDISYLLCSGVGCVIGLDVDEGGESALRDTRCVFIDKSHGIGLFWLRV